MKKDKLSNILKRYPSALETTHLMTRSNIKKTIHVPMNNLHSRIMKYQKMKEEEARYEHNNSYRMNKASLRTNLASLSHSKKKLKTIDSQENHHKSVESIKYCKFPRIMKLEDANSFYNQKSNESNYFLYSYFRTLP